MKNYGVAAALVNIPRLRWTTALPLLAHLLVRICGRWR